MEQSLVSVRSWPGTSRRNAESIAVILHRRSRNPRSHINGRRKSPFCPHQARELAETDWPLNGGLPQAPSPEFDRFSVAGGSGKCLPLSRLRVCAFLHVASN